MEKTWSSKHLGKPLLVLLACLGPYYSPAQWQEVKSVPSSPATAYSVDRRGHFYLAFSNGTLIKYDTAGREIVNFSPSRLGKITFLDAWNTLRIFVFYQEFQSIVILNRFLHPTLEYDLTAKNQGFFRLACPSQDNTFWLVDDSYNGLQKYDPVERSVISKIPFISLPFTGKVIFIREYQNVLFAALDQGGVAYFDNLGNFMGILDTEPTDHPGFNADEVYYISGENLTGINLYTQKKQQYQVPASFRNFIMAPGYLVGIKEEGGWSLLRKP